MKTKYALSLLAACLWMHASAQNGLKLEYDRITAPYLIHHGVQDRVVPIEAGRYLYSQLKNRGVITEIIEYEEYGHADIPSRPNVLLKTQEWFYKYGLIK